MIKMKIVFIFNLFILPIYLFSIENNFYKYDKTGYSFPIDLKNGNNLELIESYYNLKSKESIKDCYINTEKDGSGYFFHIHFVNGLETGLYSKVYESSTGTKVYDLNQNLISISPDGTYVYPSEHVRKYFKSGKLREIQTIEEEKDDYVKISFEEFTNKFSDENEIIYDGYITVEYFYENGLLIRYEKNTWNKHNIHYKFIQENKYYYDEKSRLVKIVSGYRDNDIRFIRHITYDENDNIKKIKIVDCKADDQNRLIEFERYDNYGNWRKSKEYLNGKLIETVTRVINYD